MVRIFRDKYINDSYFIEIQFSTKKLFEFIFQVEKVFFKILIG
jgi:hypothetical protein